MGLLLLELPVLQGVLDVSLDAAVLDLGAHEVLRGECHDWDHHHSNAKCAGVEVDLDRVSDVQVVELLVHDADIVVFHQITPFKIGLFSL